MKMLTRCLLAGTLMSIIIFFLVRFYVFTDTVWYSDIYRMIKFVLILTPFLTWTIYVLKYSITGLATAFINGDLRTRLLIISILFVFLLRKMRYYI